MLKSSTNATPLQLLQKYYRSISDAHMIMQQLMQHFSYWEREHLLSL